MISMNNSSKEALENSIRYIPEAGKAFRDYCREERCHDLDESSQGFDISERSASFSKIKFNNSEKHSKYSGSSFRTFKNMPY